MFFPHFIQLFLTLPPKPFSVFSAGWMLFVDVIFVCIFCWLLFDLGWEETGDILIWIDLFVLKWDHGLVIGGTNVLHGCWLLWQHEILFIALTSIISKFVSSYLPPPWVITQFSSPVSSPPHCTWFLDCQLVCLYILLVVVWPGLARNGWHLDLNWLVCI